MIFFPRVWVGDRPRVRKHSRQKENANGTKGLPEFSNRLVGRNIITYNSRSARASKPLQSKEKMGLLPVVVGFHGTYMSLSAFFPLPSSFLLPSFQPDVSLRVFTSSTTSNDFNDLELVLRK